MRQERDRLSQSLDDQLDCVAVGSPHFSYSETQQLIALFNGRKSAVPFYVCTNRFVLDKLETQELIDPLKNIGVELVVDTCVAVTPILKATTDNTGVMMTNSAKFAHYGPGNTGYLSVFGSLADCVESAVAKRISRDERLWQ